MTILKLLIISLTAITLVSCSTTTEPVPPPTVERLLINSSSDLGYTMEIYADAAVDVGYNPLYVRVKHDGKTLNDVHMVVVPDMDMGMMHHSCPVEQPESAVSDKDGFYHCAVIFTMPSTTAWKVGITIHDHEADTTITVHVPISVATSGNVKTIKDASNVKYVLTLLNSPWKVGMNDVTVSAYRTVDGFDYTPVDNASMKLEPTMPSMGHGSMGNIDPVSTGNSWYTGKVNLTMTGDWQYAVTMTTTDSQTISTAFQVVAK